jgi:hypothetical protein
MTVALDKRMTRQAPQLPRIGGRGRATQTEVGKHGLRLLRSASYVELSANAQSRLSDACVRSRRGYRLTPR